MSDDSQFALLKSRRFAPLFVTQFLGAFHDNLFKNALVVILLYNAASQTGHASILTTLAAGIFILPFILFSATGGQLADSFPKDKVIRVIKVIELGIAALGAASLLTGSLILCFATLFALGTHSAFFGPSKYSILPQHLRDTELIGGNAVLNTGTFLAILMGTVAGTSLIGLPGGHMIVSCLLFVVAGLGYAASRFIPAAPPKEKAAMNLNPVTETVEILAYTMKRPDGVTRAVFGIGWFYFMGGMFMAQMPNFVHDTLGADQNVLSFLLVVFSIGIAIGGLFNNKLLRGRIEAVYVPLAILGITLFSFDLCRVAAHAAVHTDVVSLPVFLGTLGNWHIIFDVAMIALCGGLFVVPLDAIIQHRTPEEHRARLQAGNAIISSAFVAASSALSAGLISAGFDVLHLFMIFAVANALVSIYTCSLLPDYLFKSIMQGIFKLLYNVEVRGIENFAKAGPRAVIVANHVSLLDPPLLAAFLPGRPMFAVNSHVAEWWWVKPFLKMIDAFPLDPTNPFSIKALIRKVESDRQVVIFPEGRLTATGSLMKVYDGPGMIADKANAMILPVRLDGVQHTRFARLKGKVPLHRFPKITITILEPRRFKISDEFKGRARRAASARQLYDLMENMMFMTSDTDQTLYQALLKAGHVHGPKADIVEDVAFKPLGYGKVIKGSMALGAKIAGMTTKGESVGLMLPNSTGAVVTFFALQAYGRVPAMLNFSTGAKGMLSSCRTANVKTILTSRRFVELGRLGDVVAQLEQQAHVVYLEDIRKQVGVGDKIRAVLGSPERTHRGQKIDPQAPAIVLFTSGSEGEPKGVVLSHVNLMSNIAQISSRVDFNRQDIVFNCLPMFHSFGLTGGTLLPILAGVKTFLYPSPLHYRIVPEMVYAANATIMFGTDTFLQGYARMANPYDFFRMRYIFAGAEKVKDETRKLYLEKFGVQVLEGYGATEAAPAIALNSAMHRAHGSVGRLLPGMEYRLEDVPGIEGGGRLYVRGPNIMLGYYKADHPGELQPPEGGWHDTGDIVSVDADGYVRILGRLKRFAKIAGEMVSLGQVEAMAQAVWPDAVHAVVTLPDPRKGEQIVLVTTQAQADRGALSAYATAHGIAGIAVPTVILHVAEVPLLGTGKTDYPGVTALAAQQVAQAA